VGRKLNPPEKRSYASKTLINACKEHQHLPVFSKRTALCKTIYDKVAGRWKELGFPGMIPKVRAFETDNKVIYHEVGGFEPGKQPGETK
jgi:4-hydroxy-3-polyprenylbenzoate decarboxylase